MTSPTVLSLADDLAALAGRVAALESRVSVLEADMAAHKAGAVLRQADIDQIRWDANHRRR